MADVIKQQESVLQLEPLLSPLVPFMREEQEDEWPPDPGYCHALRPAPVALPRPAAPADQQWPEDWQPR